MSGFQRVLAGIAIVGQLLLAIGPDAAHRWIAHGGLFAGSNSCACSHDHGPSASTAREHSHSHADHVHSGNSCDAVLSCETKTDGCESDSGLPNSDLQWASVHNAEDCGLCRLFSRPGDVPTLGEFESQIEPTQQILPAFESRLSLHRSLGHDGRGPPALQV